jgi:hypothetical protein
MHNQGNGYRYRFALGYKVGTYIGDLLAQQVYPRLDTDYDEYSD